MISLADWQKTAGYSTRPGYVNPRGQVVIRNTGLAGNRSRPDGCIKLAARICGHIYGANGSDIHHRRCPLHDRGAAGAGVCNRSFEASSPLRNKPLSAHAEDDCAVVLLDQPSRDRVRTS